MTEFMLPLSDDEDNTHSMDIEDNTQETKVEGTCYFCIV